MKYAAPTGQEGSLQVCVASSRMLHVDRAICVPPNQIRHSMKLEGEINRNPCVGVRRLISLGGKGVLSADCEGNVTALEIRIVFAPSVARAS